MSGTVGRWTARVLVFGTAWGAMGCTENSTEQPQGDASSDSTASATSGTAASTGDGSSGLDGLDDDSSAGLGEDSSGDSSSGTTGASDQCVVELARSGDPEHCSAAVDPSPGMVPQAVIAAFCSPGARPGARTVMVVGDSFSGGFADELAPRIGADARVCTMSRAGARTSQWVADEDLHDVGHGIRSLSLAALAGTTAPRVIVTMGAADVGNEFLSAGTDVHEAVLCDLARIFADIEQVAPDAEIIIAGYDITNMNPGFFSDTLGLSCPEAAAQQFGVETIANPDGDGVVVAQPACANAPLYALDSVYARLAADDEQVHYHALYGTLQDLPAGAPDLDRFANSSYYRDCVHMNDEGAQIFVDQFVALWGLVGST